MNIVYCYADPLTHWNSSQHRCVHMAKAVNSLSGYKAHLISVDEFTYDRYHSEIDRKAVENADVLVLQYKLFGRALERIEYWKSKGKIIVAEFDDAFHLIPNDNPNAEFWKGTIKYGDTIIPTLTSFHQCLKACHGYTTPSKLLTQDFLNVNPNGHVLPNWLDWDKFKDVTPLKEYPGRVVIGWGGSATHYNSWRKSGVVEALEQVCKDDPRVLVMICGSPRVFGLLKNIPDEQKEFAAWVNYYEWVKRLACFEIGLAPLHGAYDRRRSWIKMLEYGATVIQGIATNYPPYQEMGAFMGYLIDNGAHNWEWALRGAIKSRTRGRLSGPGDTTLQVNAHRIPELYQRIAERACPIPL